MPEPTRRTLEERRDARSLAVQRRRLVALLVVALLLAGAAAGAVVAARDAPAEDASGGSAAPATIATSAPAAAERSVAVETDAAAAAPRDSTVTIAATGDIVMGTPTYGLPPDGGKTFFDGVDQELVGHDVVLGNLEGTLSAGGASKCGPTSTDCYAFQTPPSYAKWLARAGFTVMNLANNHAFDFGAAGVRQTVKTLRRAGLRITGRPGQITVVEAGGVKVALVGFSSYRWANDLTDIEAAKRLVREADERADVVVVTFHGGAEGADEQHVEPGTEYFLGENRGNVVAFAHGVVDAGADLVVGHGPHVLRGMEWHRGRLIAYSLGNFGGYGVFSLAGPLSVSGILQVTLGADGTWVGGELVATQLLGEGVPALDPAERAHGVVRELSREDFGRSRVRIRTSGKLKPPR